jgi:hypothetical protein
MRTIEVLAPTAGTLIVKLPAVLVTAEPNE